MSVTARNQCAACFNICLSNEDLVRHVRRNHAGANAFRCCEVTCQRSFSLLNSFAKHRQRDHADPVVTPPATSDTSETPNVWDEEVLGDSHEGSSIRSSFTDHRPTDLCEEFKRAYTGFVSKVSSHHEIPRVRVTEILNDVNDLLEKQCDILAEQLSSLLSADVLGPVIANMKASFNFMGNSEHRRLAHFERIDWLILKESKARTFHLFRS